MDEAQFEDLVDRHGGDIASWPAPLRSSADALLANSAAAREILTRERSLKAAFAAEPAIRAPEGLALRIFALAEASDAPPEPEAAPVVAAPIRPHTSRPAPVRLGLIERFLGTFAAQPSFVPRAAVFFTAAFVIGIAIGTVFGDVASTRTASNDADLFAPIVR